MADDKKIIFSMVGVSKAFQANKQVLKDIYISFFYGAKILSLIHIFGLTRERVRQIKEKAIRRLRQNSRSKLLKSYLG